jgi:hypothetical protein
MNAVQRTGYDLAYDFLRENGGFLGSSTHFRVEGRKKIDVLSKRLQLLGIFLMWLSSGRLGNDFRGIRSILEINC